MKQVIFECDYYEYDSDTIGRAYTVILKINSNSYVYLQCSEIPICEYGEKEK